MLARRLRLAPSGDPFFAFVQLLLSFDFFVADIKGHQANWTGSPGFPGDGFDFNGTNQYLYFQSSDFDIGDQDFCAEIFFEWQSFNSTWEYVFSHDKQGARGWSIHRDPFLGGILVAHGWFNGVMKQQTGPVVALNTPYHLAVMRKDGIFRATVDGLDFGTPLAFDPSEALPVNTGSVAIGGINYAGTPINYADGICRGARLTIGHHRYEPGPFTPPAFFPGF